MLSSHLSLQVNVGEGSHPERVKVYGPGVEKTGLKANEPTYFTVDCSEAGQGSPGLGVGVGAGPAGSGLTGLGLWLEPRGPVTGRLLRASLGRVPAFPQAT